MKTRRNHAAKRRKDRRVAILIDPSSSWGRDIIRGAVRQARTREGWLIKVENPTRGLSPDCLREVDGVIARVSDAALARFCRQSGRPVVNVSAINLPKATFARVATDVEAAGRMAVAYFRERGFRHFAYLSQIGRDYVSRQRRAFAAAVQAAGCRCEELGLASPEDSPELSGRAEERRLREWLKGLPKPVALFLWSGGRQIVDCCLDAGLSVPEEIAILSGSNDSLLCEVANIPISAIQQPCERIGREAVGVLENLMNGRSTPRSPCWLPPERVVTRQSTDTLAVSDRALVAALQFIRQSAGRPTQVGDVVARSGVSRRELERRFARHFQSTPAEFLRRAHLDRARSLLAETDLSIPDIAQASGFGSPEYMAQIFRARLQTSPLRYRREVRGR
jgi:LacI family transcriptional regulator